MTDYKHYCHPECTNYYTTSQGRIYNFKSGRELKGIITKGYTRISIRPKEKNPIGIPAHVFIWEAYNKKEIDKLYDIIHIDGNKLNNKPRNLKQVITKSSNPFNTERKILATNPKTGVVRKFDSIYNASQMLQINTGYIKLIAEGKRKTATSKFNSNKYYFKYFNPHDLDLVKRLKDRIRK